MNYTHEIISQKHGIFLRISIMGVNLRMTIKMMTCKIKCFLIQRSRYRTVYFTCHSQFNGFYHGFKCRIAALGGNLALLESLHVYAMKVVNVDCSILELRIFYIRYSIYCQFASCLLSSIFHYGCVSGDNRGTLVVCLFQT